MRRFRPIGLVFVAMAALVSACRSEHSGIVAADRTVTPGKLGRMDAAMVASCGDGSLTAAGAADIVRPPYVQQVQSSAATLVWAARRGATDVRLDLTTPDGSLVSSVSPRPDAPANPAAAEHLVASVTGLAADEIYCWSIR